MPADFNQKESKSRFLNCIWIVDYFLIIHLFLHTYHRHEERETKTDNSENLTPSLYGCFMDKIIQNRYFMRCRPYRYDSLLFIPRL